MPQMGESIAEGTLSRWLKQVGDEVKRDEPIFEISTDKVDAEIPAPAAGVLAEILVQQGQTVPVQTVVARLETEKGAMVGVGAPTAPSGASVASEAPGAGGPPPIGEANAPAPANHHPSAATPPQFTPPSTSGNGNTFEDRVRTKSSPLVRKIAAEHGIEISALHGTGVAGRVTKKDILQFLESGAHAPAVQRPGARPGAPVPP